MWDGLDLSRKRAILDALAEVTLLPGKPGPGNHTAETVQVAWK